MITRRHFLSSCAVTAATPCADAVAITDQFTITVTTAHLPVPSLVQMVSSASNTPAHQSELAQNAKFFLPNAVGAGNCITLAISYQNGLTPTITDNNGNSWPASPTVSVAGGQVTAAIFVLPNANAGVTQFNVAFASTGSNPFQYTICEWYNVSGANGSQSTGNQTGASLTVGSFTPVDNNANGGNLIFAYFASTFNSSSGSLLPTSWVAGGSFTLLDADSNQGQGFPHASMSFVQTTSAAINPGLTATGDTSNAYNCVAVALKAASVGTPIPAGIHINKILHFINDACPTTWNIQTPATGNLRVVTGGIPVASNFTDNEGGGTWASPNDGQSSAYYSANKSANPTLVSTLSGASFNAGLRFYDIQGAAAAPFDTDGFAHIGADGLTTINNVPNITPTVAGDLVIVYTALGLGPGLGFASGAPAGAIWDFVNYDGQSDSSDMDHSDCAAHVYNASTSQITWNFNITANTSNSADAGAYAFKGA
jgi:hypothetical protein